MGKNRWIKISFPIILLAGIYFMGSTPEAPKFSKTMPVVPADPASLEGYVREKEARHKIKPENEAQIVWFDSLKNKTPCAIVYLHGFSASQKEGDPIHRRLAQEFGCNLYLSRLADHGVDTTEALQQFTADRWWESAKEALAIGRAIGEKIILVSTSTGGTVALMLAAEYPDQVNALVNLSPNIAINDPAAFILNDPWGLQIARMVMGGKYRNAKEHDDEIAKYWNEKYRLEAAVQLEELLESSMNEGTFRKVKQPSLTLYYYKNEEEQDPQVKVSAMLKMNEQLGTPDSLKVIKAMPDAGAHVIGSPITSKDVEGVYLETESFITQKVKLQKVPAPLLNE